MIDKWSYIATKGIRTGKTTAICEAARKIGAIVVTGSEKEAKRITKEFGVTAMSIHHWQLTQGLDMPFLFDTYGVTEMAADFETAYEIEKRKREQLEEKLNMIQELLK
jgi:hypothetical protein